MQATLAHSNALCVSIDEVYTYWTRRNASWSETWHLSDLLQINRRRSDMLFWDPLQNLCATYQAISTRFGDYISFSSITLLNSYDKAKKHFLELEQSVRPYIPTAVQRETSASPLSPIGRTRLTPPYEYDPNQWQISLSSRCHNRGSVLLLWMFFSAMLQSALLPFQALLHFAALIKGFFCFITFPWSCGVLKRIWWVMYQTLFCLGMMSSQNGDRNGLSYIKLKIRRCASPEATPSAVAIIAANLLRADWVCVLACMW